MNKLKTCVALFVLVLSVLCSKGHSADYYTWRDEAGNVHFSDSYSSVPERYRDQIESKRFTDENREMQAPARETAAPAADGEKRKAAPGGPAGKEAGAGKKQAKKHEIKYTNREGSAKRVIVQARINGTVTAQVAVDTGAPSTVITASLARKLGLFDNEHGKLLVAAGGIGGTVPAIRTFLDTIEIGGTRSEFVPTTIVRELSPAFEGLLGLDFVSNYLVTIDSVRSVIIFEEIPPNPEHFAGRDREWWTALFREFASYRAIWKEYSDELDRKIRNSMNSTNNPDIEIKELADDQCREAEKLLDKLNVYATRHSVPTTWRTY